MDTFKFTGSSCLKLAKGSTLKDLAAFVGGMSFRLTACEGSTGRLCDAVAAFSAISPCFTLPAGLQTFLPLQELPACPWTSAVPIGIRYTRRFPLTFRRWDSKAEVYSQGRKDPQVNPVNACLWGSMEGTSCKCVIPSPGFPQPPPR